MPQSVIPRDPKNPAYQSIPDDLLDSVPVRHGETKRSAELRAHLRSLFAFGATKKPGAEWHCRLRCKSLRRSPRLGQAMAFGASLVLGLNIERRDLSRGLRAIRDILVERSQRAWRMSERDRRVSHESVVRDARPITRHTSAGGRGEAEFPGLRIVTFSDPR